MGEVWLAAHALLGRQAAIKLLHPEFTAREDIVSRFFNEARATTVIADPGIVQIFDFGYAGASAYIVMELLDGETLDARVGTRVLAVHDALRITRQVAASLGAAHARGIVHRDLKPENIYLVRDPEVAGGERAKILDFGIAKLTEHNGPKTVTATVMGTPAYMSPEQCRGAGKVDARADVYSLGCVLFAILAGHPPFLGEGIGDLIVQHISAPAPRVSSRRADVPPAVDALIARCLEKDPARRYASGADLARAIEEVMGMVPATAAVVSPSVVSATHMNAVTTLSSAVGATTTGIGARPNAGKRVALVGVGTAFVAGVVVVLATRGGAPAANGSDAVASTAGVAAPKAAVPDASVAAAGSHVAAVVAPPPLDERPALAERQLATLADRFKAWAPQHAGQGCPRASELGREVDPWGTAWVVTCTEQPEDQAIGLISAGPDGTLGSADDVRSWTVPSSARVLVGPRWTATKQTHRTDGPNPKPRPRPTTVSPPRTDGPKPTTASPPRTDGSSVPPVTPGIPTSR
jgi:serine/threonine-protein kinase